MRTNKKEKKRKREEDDEEEDEEKREEEGTRKKNNPLVAQVCRKPKVSKGSFQDNIFLGLLFVADKDETTTMTVTMLRMTMVSFTAMQHDDDAYGDDGDDGNDGMMAMMAMMEMTWWWSCFVS